jgi:hypothetical protein
MSITLPAATPLTAPEIYIEAMLSSNMYANGGNTILTAVKGEIGVNRAISTNPERPFECNPTDDCGDLTVEAVSMRACKYKTKLHICKDTIESTLDQKPPFVAAAGFNPPNGMTTITDLVESQVLRWINRNTDMYLWRSSTALSPSTCGETPLELCDGWIRQMENDATVIDVPSPVVVTPSNILSELQRIYALIPPEIIGDPALKADLKIYAGVELLQILTIAYQNGNQLTTLFATVRVGNDAYTYNGIPIIFTHGLPVAAGVPRIVCTPGKNLVILTDLQSDAESMRQIDLSLTSANDSILFVGSRKVGAGVIWGSQVVLY